MEHTLIDLLLLFIAGCIGGILNAIAGGGTLVTFPVLVLTGIPSVPANATSAVALLPAFLGSIASYRLHFKSIAQSLKILIPVSLLGGIIGSILLVSTPSEDFDIIAPFLILFATLLFMAQDAIFRKIHPQWFLGAFLIQFLISLYGGYFGAGLGILMLASLGMLGYTDIHHMNTLKVILGFLINSIAAIYFILSGIIYWEQAGIMAAGALLGGYGGAWFAQKLTHDQVKTIITIIGLIISGIMFYEQIR
jgi:uncharacterized membrane protein YfcA